MSLRSKIIFLIIPLIIPVALVIWSAQAGAANVYTMSGRISAINLNAETVVVEVPVKDDQLLTVGGPVTEDAALQKHGQKADLQSFNVGEWVQVTWEKTEETLLIKKLAGK